MLFSYQLLQTFFEKKLPAPQKLADLLTAHTFEVEGIEKCGKDFVLNIDVLPNRSHDCFGHRGVAREISILTGLKMKEKRPVFKDSKKAKTSELLALEVEDRNACPRYIAKVILGVQIKDSPKWIKDCLVSCGLRPVNNVVDATNYAMLETGQPLHAFDLDKIEQSFSQKNQKISCNTQRKIVVRNFKDGEKIETLDDKEAIPGKTVLAIADEAGALAIAGIKGGKKAEILQDTVNIVLEAANFDPRNVRLASQKINLKTDASLRFEHGLDPNLALLGMERAIEIILENSGGQAAWGYIDFYPQKKGVKIIRFDMNKAQNVLGLDLKRDEVIGLFKKLGFSVKEAKKNILDVTVSSERLDLELPEDLMEEVGRLIGYDQVKPSFPFSRIGFYGTDPLRGWDRLAKDAMKEMGFTENLTHSFVSEKDLESFGIKENEVFEIANPVSSESKYLRPSLLIGLVKVYNKNLRHSLCPRFFEVGKIFQCKGTVEKKTIAAVCGLENFPEIKGYAETLMEKLGIPNAWYDDFEPKNGCAGSTVWNERKSAEIKIGNTKVGFIGEAGSEIARAYGFERAAMFEIDFDKLCELAAEENLYRPVSYHPRAFRDISLVAPLTVRVAQVMEAIEISGGELVFDVDLIDIYADEKIGEGRKNLTFRIIFQAPDRTLSNEELSELQDKIIKKLEERPEWEVRK